MSSCIRHKEEADEDGDTGQCGSQVTERLHDCWVKVDDDHGPVCLLAGCDQLADETHQHERLRDKARPASFKLVTTVEGDRP